MKKNSFGKLIKDQRKFKKLKQEEVLKKLEKQGIEISQSALSSWERGSRWPRSDKVINVIAAFNQALGLSVDDLNKAYRKTLSSIDINSDVGSEAVIKSVGDILHIFGHENTEIWFVGSESLPILRDNSFNELWVNNLCQGVSYNVIVFFDDYDADNIRDMMGKFETIEELLKEGENKGSINTFPVSLAGQEDLSEQIDVYNSFKKSLDANSVIKLNEIAYNWHQTISYRSIMSIWQSFSTITMYISKEAKHRPYANINLLDVSREHESESTDSPYFWFNSKRASIFHKAIKNFKKEIINEDSL